MGWEAWVAVTVVFVMVLALVRGLARPDVLMIACLGVFMVMGLWSERFPQATDLVAGFGNEGLVTVGMLFVVVCGLTQTNAMTAITQPLLGRPRSVGEAQSRLMFPVATASAFMNNTPIVAMFMPVVNEWCKKTGISPSKLFIPLSFATVLGGLCTLIGTSTNIVVHGLMKEQNGGQGLAMFDITWVGVPVAVVGLLYMLLFSRWLLPDRKAALSQADDPREYTVEMIVEPESALVDHSIEQAGLRHLPGMFLVEIDRDGHQLPAVSPLERLRGGDRLVFVGVVESVVDLQKIRGLVPATDQVFKLQTPRTNRCMVEAVVSNTCPIVGKTIREGRFRSRYGAAVLAVARNGQRLRKKIGDIVLEAGDTLLLETSSSFVDQQRNSRDFFLISRIEGAVPPRHDRAWIAMLILIGMVVTMSFGWLGPLAASTVAACLMIATRCCSASEARHSVEWEVLLVIGAALGIAKVLQSTGAAGHIASGLINLGEGSPWLVLALVYFSAMLFTEILTNNAAAALIFPIAWASAEAMGVSPMPFVIAVAIASSCGFATPLGYTTHLMVYGPGGYKFSDYLRIGLPLNFLVMATTLTVLPWVWPFH